MTVTIYKWTIERYHRLQNGRYTSEQTFRTGVVSPLAFQDVQIQVQRLMSQYQ